MSIPFYVQAAWFAGALLFIFGLKGMSSPTTARRGIVWAGVGMLLAIFGTFFVPHLNNIGLMLLALVVGASAAWMRCKQEMWFWALCLWAWRQMCVPRAHDFGF